MSQELAMVRPNYLVPQTFEQAERYAEKIANSSLCPNAFKNKPGDVLIAMQMGAEVGLSPMQALQNTAVINGRPSIWGDAALGLVRCHPHCVSVREWSEGTLAENNIIAYCGVIRKGQKEEIRTFTIEQAKKAGLWGKTGPWSQYPERMLQMRARGFAIRDVFPDALRGLHIAEEAQDIPADAQTIAYEVVEEHKKHVGTPLSLTATTDPTVVTNLLSEIDNCKNMDELKEVYIKCTKSITGDKESINKIVNAKNAKKESLEKKPSKETEEHSDFIAALGE